MSKAKISRIHQMTIAQFEAIFPDEDACKDYLCRTAGQKACAARAAAMSMLRSLTTKAHHWQCYNCAEPGTATAFPSWSGRSSRTPTSPCATGSASCT